MDWTALSGSMTAAILASALQWLAALLYAVALVALAFTLRRGGRGESPLDQLAVVLGAIAHLASLVIKGALQQRLPIGNLQESFSFLALLLAGSYLITAARFAFPLVELMQLGLVTLFMAFASLVPADPSRLAAPELKSRWFVFHVLTSFFGLAALFLSFVLSALYLVAEHQLKEKKATGLSRFLPSLVACDRLSHRLLALGFPLMTVGIAAGVKWSASAPGWRWGFKESSFVAAWLIFALLIHIRVVRGMRGRKAALLSIVGSVVALVAIFGIRT